MAPVIDFPSEQAVRSVRDVTDRPGPLGAALEAKIGGT
jgi:hypothetical protein